MTVALDSFNSAQGTGNLTVSMTPVGTPRAVLAFVAHGGSTDEVTSVTYGGTALTELTGSPNAKAAAEAGIVYAYFLGSSVPSGNQDLAVTVSGATTKRAYCILLTAAGDTETVDVDATINSNSVANPSVTLSLAGRTCFCAISFVSGQDAVSGITPLTDWTSQNEADAGIFCLACYTYDTIGSADVTAGWTQGADDAIAIAVAVSETQATTGTSTSLRYALARRRIR